jgi:ectoine hydroxylase-related dioxygenase (phytanoyl-CoA dioxygenase family)
MKVLSPFGPKLGKFKLSKTIINKINNEVERIIANKNLSRKFNYSKKLVGQVKEEFQLPQKFINNHLLKTIHKEVKIFIKKALGKDVRKVKIKNLWVVRQFKNEYNPVHYHDGHLSAVGYLKIPKNINQSKKKTKTNGTIDFINGSKNFLSDSIYNHVPKVGDIIFFPNYLMHTAYPFYTEGERRSFSMNIELDEKTANVFHD